MELHRLYFDPENCTGCKVCELTCSMTKENAFAPILSRIKIVLPDEKAEIVAHVCHQCNPAECMEACPEEAIQFHTGFGAVVIDPEKCSGCGECIDACPYDAIEMNEEADTAFKCDLCGGNPRCVEGCIYGALTFGAA